YPRSFQNPESNGVWFEKDLVVANQTIKLRDQRTVINNIERRVQEYIAPDWEKQIITERRFYSKKEIQLILERSGFKNIEFTDGYQIDGFHQLNSLETVKSSFVVKAEK
ncbi:MAG TPA: hypothetical protein PL158_07010, partial [Bacillota bacterium]|nr:hypothetical protein [Bacillota bacterium]